MSIKIAEHAGFCFGVKRAVDMVDQLLDKGEKVCTLGPLIHNPQVVESFQRRGAVVVETSDDIPEGYTVVIRSHGVEKQTLEECEKAAKVVNATCPYVQKIHNLAAKAAEENKHVLVLGDENHPEVKGIVSHCTKGQNTFSSCEKLITFYQSDQFSTNKDYILVAQTTFNQNDWLKCKEFTEKAYTNVHIFDTICNATVFRQKAAKDLSNVSDYMIVVGGKESSNTKKLVQICAESCQTIHIEYPSELLQQELPAGINIGVTAGASTPAFIIKEVQNIMSDVVNNKEEMSFEEMLDQSFKTVSASDKVTGIVTSVEPNEIAVDIGTKHAGYVPLYEYTDDPNIDLQELVKPGDEIELLVLRLNDAEGTALLSKKRLDAIAGFDKIVKAEEADEKLTGTVVDVVKGGIIVLTHGVRVFIPASQSSLHRGQDLEELRGTEVEYKILETNRNRRRAVGSIRAVLREERKELAEKFWSEVEVGQVRKGVVKSLTSYGAFIDLGGVDGMAHISELSWTRIKHPSDVMEVGQEVEVLVKDVNREEEKVSLSYKQEGENPWKILERDYTAGAIVPVKIVSLTSFGAFAQVIPGVDGLIHISQISHDRIDKPSDVLSIGDEVNVAITDIDFDRKRVSLSIRALLDDQEQRKRQEEKEEEKPEPKKEVREVETEAVVGQFGPSDDVVVQESLAKELAKAEAEEELEVEAHVDAEDATAEGEAEKIAEDAKVAEAEAQADADTQEVIEDILEVADEEPEKESLKDKAKDLAKKVEDKAEEIEDKLEDAAEKVEKKAKEIAEKIEDELDD